VVWCAHYDKVDLLGHLVEHLTKVSEFSGPPVLCLAASQLARIYIAESHNIAVLGGRLNVAPALPSNPDGGNADPFVG
jgi:hypothetical protein